MPHPRYRLQREAPPGFEKYRLWWPFMNALVRYTKPVSSRASDNDGHKNGNEEIIWLKWRQWSDRVNTEVLEAIGLLALLLQDDPKQWCTLLHEIWTDAYVEWSDELPSETKPSWSVSPPSLRLGLLLCSCDERMLRQWREHMTSDNVSATYKQLRATMVHVGVTTPLRPIPVRLMFDDLGRNAQERGGNGGEGEEDDETSEFSLQLQGCVQLVHDELASATTTTTTTTGRVELSTALFRVEQVDLNKVSAPLTGDDLECLSQLATLGVHLCHLRLESATVTATMAVAYSKPLQELLAVSGEGLTQNQRAAAVRSVSISTCATRQTHDAVFSALLTSQSIRKVSVVAGDRDENPSRGRQCRLWQWLAAAVFSAHSSNAIDHFVLDARTLALSDARALETTLREPDPVASLYHRRSPSEMLHHANQLVYVTTPTFRLSPPPASQFGNGDGDGDASSPMLVLDRPLAMELRVLGAWSGPWLSVLLPGWGQSWVKQSDTEPAVKKHTLLPPSHSPHSMRAVHHITIQFPDTSNQLAVAAFLRVVGRGCTHLTLKNWNDRNTPPTDDWFHSVFQACPNLDEISFDQFPFPSLSVFANAYETELCRIQKLRLLANSSVSVGNIPEFLQCLANRDHAMARHLTDLTLTIPKMAESLATFNALMLTVVQQNRRLAGISLSLCTDEQLTLESMQETDVFHKYDMCPVAAQLAPLQTTSKVAFLSVVRGGTRAAQRSAAETLDSRAIALIFQFAAQCRTRSLAWDISSRDLAGRMR